MCHLNRLPLLMLLITYFQTIDCYYREIVQCGSFGFACLNYNKLRLCEDKSLFGPTFNCPPNTFCNDESSDVCEQPINHIAPSYATALKCRRNERLADPSVPGCKGYVLCVQNRANQNTIQYIKFKCSGKTIFNGKTRTCSSAENYKCPLNNATKNADHFQNNRKAVVSHHQLEHLKSDEVSPFVVKSTREIDCKNYKFRVTEDDKPAMGTYFCPSRPAPGERSIRCTIFSNSFCVTLERDDEDQFALSSGIAYRKPRNNHP